MCPPPPPRFWLICRSAEVRTVLAGLARAHLAEAAPGAAGRWRMHDLLRLYAQRLSDEHADADGREQARDRLLGYYLTMAAAADEHLRALPGMAVPDEFTGRDRCPGLAGCGTGQPGGRGDDGRRRPAGTRPPCACPCVLAEYLDWRRRCSMTGSLSPPSAWTLPGASATGDSEGDALTNLGLALREVRRFEEAITACQDAAAICRETGDRHREGRP